MRTTHNPLIAGPGLPGKEGSAPRSVLVLVCLGRRALPLGLSVLVLVCLGKLALPAETSVAGRFLKAVSACRALGNHASPMYLQGRDLYDSDEVIDGDLHPSCAVHTEGDHTPIPFEPRLVDQCDENGRRKSKKETVNIDLIVVDSESNVTDAIEDFDIVICKCSWDGNLR